MDVICGLMDADILESIFRTKSKDSEFIIGVMVNRLKDIGIKTSYTEELTSYEKMDKPVLENGIMGKGLYENRGSQEDYTRTRLSTNSSNLSIASLIIDKHSSKDCS